MTTQQHWIGVMSGSSLDGIDVALLSLNGNSCTINATYFQPYPEALRNDVLKLHAATDHELENAFIVSNLLAVQYAQAINTLLKQQNLTANDILAIGCHGQTIRHQPLINNQPGFSIQLGNHALIAELTNICVVGDFRSRDIAAGGQGAPLVPAFHQAVFASQHYNRAIVNIGGIANISYLKRDGEVIGFDTGPGNMLIDHWTQRHTQLAYDKNGNWAAAGTCSQPLLERMLSEPFFALPPPKSTGRDLFNVEWLSRYTQSVEEAPAQDIAHTLTQLTASTIAQSISQYCSEADEVYVCGGGAHNAFLMSLLKEQLQGIPVDQTDELGISVDWVEAAAFGWLAKQAIEHQPANLPSATGARGPRILGAIYPN